MSIDLIRHSGYMLLVYVDDQIWRATPAADRGCSIYDLAKNQVSEPKLKADLADTMDVRADPYRFCVAHYARSFDSFVICDVGSQYGTTTMDTIQTAKEAGGHFKTFAFDAGVAGELAWRNFENNRFDVAFMQAAVGPYDGHAAMFSEPGQSENNRLVNGRDSVGFPVRCVRLDTVLKAADAFGPACIKIDVQGAEPAVLAGMQELLSSQLVTMQLEFTPWAMRESQIDPCVFLDQLLVDNHVFDIGYDRQHLIEITSTAEAVTRVDSADPYWTDILVVPRRLRGIEFVLQRLRMAGAHGG